MADQNENTQERPQNEPPTMSREELLRLVQQRLEAEQPSFISSLQVLINRIRQSERENESMPLFRRFNWAQRTRSQPAFPERPCGGGLNMAGPSRDPVGSIQLPSDEHLLDQAIQQHAGENREIAYEGDVSSDSPEEFEREDASTRNTATVSAAGSHREEVSSPRELPHEDESSDDPATDDESDYEPAGKRRRH